MNITYYDWDNMRWEKIPMIRLLRAAFDCGLKDGKKLVELLIDIVDNGAYTHRDQVTTEQLLYFWRFVMLGDTHTLEKMHADLRQDVKDYYIKRVGDPLTVMASFLRNEYVY